MRGWGVSFALVLSLCGASVLAERWYTLYSQAIRDLEAGRYEVAITRLETAISQNPKSGSSIRADATTTVRYFPYFLLGKAYFHAHKYEEAMKSFAQESRSNVPEKLAAAILYYQQEIRSIQDRARGDEFNRAVAASEVANKEGAFVHAAEQLEKARQIDQAEFEKRGLAKVLATVRESEKQRVADAERQKTEAIFLDLVRQASEKEKRGAVTETAELLQKADQLIPRRAEVEELRRRVKDREDKYAQAKEAASAALAAGRMADAVGFLKQAEQAHPDKYQAEKLVAWADSLARQAEIRERLNAAAGALDQGQYGQAIGHFDKVLEADPENMTAKTQKSRAQFLGLLAQGDDLAKAGSFAEALQVFQDAQTQHPAQGPEVYERMQAHLAPLRAARSPLRNDWLELMRNSDPDRFAAENRAVAASRRHSRRVRPAAPTPEVDIRRDVLASLKVEPQEAVQMLEKVRATEKRDSAELESWTGVAYARLSFLTADPRRKEELRVKATQHFRRALKLDPQHRLNSRLVPPRILQLFADARQ
ncbi:MAG: hypothetical protein ACE15E_01590 [Acidobacteriota bacterium]